MTKADLVNEIVKRTGIDKLQVLTVVEASMKLIKNSVSEKNNVYLRGFGTFYAKKRAQKIGQIITKKQQVVIPEHYVPAFKPGKTFSAKVKHAYEEKL